MAAEPLTVTVDAVDYEDTADTGPVVTPLGVELRQTLELDNLVATWAVGPVSGHRHIFKPEAVGNRMYLYGLDVEQDAVDALVREVVFAWSGLEPETDDQAGRLGGIDSRITVEWTPGAIVDRATLLDRFHARIAAKRASYDPPAPLELE